MKIPFRSNAVYLKYYDVNQYVIQQLTVCHWSLGKAYWVAITTVHTYRDSTKGRTQNQQLLLTIGLQIRVITVANAPTGCTKKQKEKLHECAKWDHAHVSTVYNKS